MSVLSDHPDIRAASDLAQTVEELRREVDATTSSLRAVDALAVEQRATIASLRAELAALRAAPGDGLREAAKLAWAFCHEAQQRLIVDDGFRAQAEVAFSMLDRVLYPPGYPASAGPRICWDCQVGGPVCGPCAKCATAPSPREDPPPVLTRCEDSGCPIWSPDPHEKHAPLGAPREDPETNPDPEEILP